MSQPMPVPNPWITSSPYSVPRHPAPITLRLDGNEGAPPPERMLECLGTLTPTALQRYPDPRPLEAKIAQRFGLDRESVLVTAGADEGLMRMCRGFLQPGRTLVLPEPSFDMIRRFAVATGAAVRSVPFPEGSYPIESVLRSCDDTTAMVAVVSPNNPTGGTISAGSLRRLSEEIPHAMLMVDLAYVEFADEDLTATALSLPNAVVFRTFSKASGMAGLRLGYAMGAVRWIRVLRAAGLPYPVSAPSLAIGHATVDATPETSSSVEGIKQSRAELTRALHDEGIPVFPSQGNFVFMRGLDGTWWRDAMAGLGIGIRAWPNSPELADAIRISCPSNPAAVQRVCHAISTIRQPEAILFDLDGVLADVSASYREAIRQTAAHFGVCLSPNDIERIKAAGDANNDWIVTWRLLTNAGIDANLGDVTALFESLYQGASNREPLHRHETLIGRREDLIALRTQYRLGIVTGRPRADADRFLADFGLDTVFDAVICMEDAAAKPSPEPVEAALRALGVQRAWMLGDTPDDAVAARTAGVLPVGVVAPGASPSTSTTLLKSGAAVVLDRWDQILERLV